MKKYFKNNPLLIFLLIIACSVFLKNLSGQDYSLDEPETVILAKTIFKNILPSAWNGSVFVSGVNGLDSTYLFGRYVWTWHPRFQHYLAFLGILVGGNSIAAVRFPFALIGVFCILIFYFLAKELFEKKLVAFILALQLIFLLPFFLYIRQVRYYGVSALFSLTSLLLFVLILKGQKNKKTYFLFFISFILLFFSDYLTWASSICSLLVLSLPYAQNFIRKAKTSNASILRLWAPGLFLIFIFQIFFGLAWLTIFKPFGTNIFISGQSVKEIVIGFLKYLSYVNSYIFPLILTPLLLVVKKNKWFYLVIIWIFVKLLFDAVFLVPHGRYLVELFPIFILFYGYFYVFLFKQRLVFLSILLAIFVSSNNILNVAPWFLVSPKKFVPNFWPKDYLIELTGKYKDLMPAVGADLKKSYHKGDLFWSNEYRLYIYNNSGIAYVSPVCNLKNNRLVGPPSLTNPSNIKWFIFFQHDPRFPQSLENIPCLGKKWQRNLEEHYAKTYITFKPRTVLVNDPDIVNRRFPPSEVPSKDVVVYERK